MEVVRQREHLTPHVTAMDAISQFETQVTLNLFIFS